MDYQKVSYAKWLTDEEGKIRKRYCAIDPADEAVCCTCLKPDCYCYRLLPLRSHIAELYRVILKIHEEEIAWTDPPEWSSVLYALRMAASIEDIEADTGFVEDPMVFDLCDLTIDFENAQSEMASKYVAGATIFNFLWLAYEAVVGLAAPDELRRLLKDQRMGERGRRLLEARPTLTSKFIGIENLTRLALGHCRDGGRMEERCEQIQERYGKAGLVTAAELAREYRNFVVHGGDEVPQHEKWGDVVTARCRIYRFYSVGRVVLYLIQAMCWIVHEKDQKFHEYGSDDDAMTACEVFERLQYIGPGIWPPLIRSER